MSDSQHNSALFAPMRLDRGALSALIIQTLAIEGFDFDTM